MHIAGDIQHRYRPIMRAVRAHPPSTGVGRYRGNQVLHVRFGVILLALTMGTTGREMFEER
jgi:hypothetical protein